jgi:hypothetical protein
LSRTFFFATREPIFQTSQPSAAFLRVLIRLMFPGRGYSERERATTKPPASTSPMAPSAISLRRSRRIRRLTIHQARL